MVSDGSVHGGREGMVEHLTSLWTGNREIGTQEGGTNVIIL
jgi:hypothetical protein